MLKQEYDAEMDVAGSMLLAIKTLHKTLDINKLTHEKIELATLMRRDGKTELEVLGADKVIIIVY